jgi:hypothetical protein
VESAGIRNDVIQYHLSADGGKAFQPFYIHIPTYLVGKISKIMNVPQPTDSNYLNINSGKLVNVIPKLNVVALASWSSGIAEETGAMGRLIESR